MSDVNRVLGWLAVLLLVAAGSVARAQEVPADVPLTYQGDLIVNGSPIADGEYTFNIRLYGDENATQLVCGDVDVPITVTGGRFSHTLQDRSCREKIRTANSGLWVQVQARGGPLGGSYVTLGVHPVSAGVYALRAETGGGAVGDIVASLLTEEQFQAIRGPNWILADGRDVQGSAFAQLFGNNFVPDLRGVFLRGKQNNRNDGKGNPNEIALGEYQADAFKRHQHGVAPSAGPEAGFATGVKAAASDPAGQDVLNGNTGEAGEEETRPQNVTVNFFIRIN
ncbi:MAG: hypothetical protein D6729_05135 [Deltaproteobacteria bacterium]|nr:MAG: hypothetical protein D6729_05135 [Deltaproteobacteria bacterium]